MMWQVRKKTVEADAPDTRSSEDLRIVTVGDAGAFGNRDAVFLEELFALVFVDFHKIYSLMESTRVLTCSKLAWSAFFSSSLSLA